MKTEWTDNDGGWGSVTVTMDDGTEYQADVAYDERGGEVDKVTDMDGNYVDMLALPDGVLAAMQAAADAMSH